MFKSISKFNKNNLYNEYGSTSIEYALIIFVIVSLITSMIFMAGNVKSKYYESICKINCSITESKYNAYLRERDIASTEALFVRFIDEYKIDICPENHKVTYVNGNITCDFHFKEAHDDEHNNESKDEMLPFL